MLAPSAVCAPPDVAVDWYAPRKGHDMVPINASARPATWIRKLFRWAIRTMALFSITQAVFGLDRHEVVFSKLAPTRMSVFVADGNGRNERSLAPSKSLDYNASFSADGRWIVFTSERGGSADVY